MDWFSQEADGNGHYTHDSKEYTSKMEVMDFGNYGRSGISFSTRGRWAVAKLPHKPHQTNC